VRSTAGGFGREGPHVLQRPFRGFPRLPDRIARRKHQVNAPYGPEPGANGAGQVSSGGRVLGQRPLQDRPRLLLQWAGVPGRAKAQSALRAVIALRIVMLAMARIRHAINDSIVCNAITHYRRTAPPVACRVSPVAWSPRAKNRSHAGLGPNRFTRKSTNARTLGGTCFACG